MYEPALNSLCFTDLQRLKNWQAECPLQMYPNSNKGNVQYVAAKHTHLDKFGNDEYSRKFCFGSFTESFLVI